MSENKVLAVVNGKEITEDIVVKFLNDLGPQMAMQFQSPDGIKRVVYELVNQEVIYMDALEKGLDKAEAYITELDRIKEGLLKQFALNEILSKIDVTEGEVLEFYNANKESFKTPETVVASHILVDSEEKANEIIAEVNAGLAFEEAAMKYSSCPSKEQGGNLGEFSRGQMVPEFENAAFEMEINSISAPVKTQFGYHVIKLVEKNEAATSKFDEVKPQIMQQVLTMKQQQEYIKITEELKNKYSVVVNM